MTSGIIRRHRLKIVYFVVAIAAGMISTWLVKALGERVEGLLLFLVALTVVQGILLGMALYCSRLRKRLPRTGAAAVFSWVMVGAALLMIVVINASLVPAGIIELWIKLSGEASERAIGGTNTVCAALFVNVYLILACSVILLRERMRRAAAGYSEVLRRHG